MASRLDLPPRGLDGGDDVRVSAAAADVAAHLLPHLVVAPGPALVEQRDRAHDLSRGAVAALERIVGDERGLHRVEFVAPGETLDGRDLGALGGDREGQARVDRATVDQHRAGAALAVIATLPGPGQE